MSQAQDPEEANSTQPTRGINRRSLLKAGIAAAAFAGASGLVKDAKAKIVDFGRSKRTIIGYSWPWTVRPGESIDFKVGTYAPGEYQADLVRLICGDGITDNGKHYREEAVASSFAGQYPGRNQALYSGSYAEIYPVRGQDNGDSFTVMASIYPTRLINGSQLAGEGFTPGFERKGVGRDQHIVARWDDVAKKGWSLAIDKDDRLVFYAGDGSGQVDRVVLDKPLFLRRWVRVWAAYDAARQTLILGQDPVYSNPGDRVVRQPEEKVGTVSRLVQDGPLRFGAALGEAGNGKCRRPAGAFNGKLDTLRITKGAISTSEIQVLLHAKVPGRHKRSIIGWWDFAKGTGTTKVHDMSGNKLDGDTINLPERAVIGVRWDGTELNWKTAPDHYSAIYFHDSAMIDAEWQTDFSYKVPADLPSGIYAAKLNHNDSEDYIPFYVTPTKGKPKAKIAFVVPTMTYLAYANTTGVSTYTRTVTENGKTYQEEWMPIFKEEKTTVEMAMAHWNDFGMGVYRFHSDGAPVRHAPMRIPNISLRPKVTMRHLPADTDIIEWLEHEGVEYDVITDELIHAEGYKLLSDYRVVITGSHAEYLSHEMFDAYSEFLTNGGRLMSIGGNGFHNVIHFHAEVPGVVECRKNMEYTPSGQDLKFENIAEFDGRLAGRFREVGTPANVLHGVGTNYPHPMTAGTYYRRLPGADDPRASFIFAGVTDQKLGNFGKSGSGAVSEECDAADYTDGTPAHTLIVARSENMVWPMVSEDGLTAEKYRSLFNPKAEMVFYETANGGAVFSVGSMGYRGSLYYNGFDNNIARITKNVLTRFSDPKPFKFPG